MHPDICIALPCLNPTLAQWKTLEAFIADFNQRVKSRATFLVVNDGSPKWIDPPESLRGKICLINSPQNLGKGGALKLAVKNIPSQCKVFAFTDFDLPYAIDDLVGVCAAVLGGVDVCIGDRSTYFTKGRSDRTSRDFSHRLFRLFVRTIVTGGITDTQCGLKAYRADAVNFIAQAAKLDSFLFDVEWLYIAMRHRLAVRCWPVKVLDEHASTQLRSMRHLRMFKDLGRLTLGILRKQYDNQKLVQWLKNRLAASYEIV